MEAGGVENDAIAHPTPLGLQTGTAKPPLRTFETEDSNAFRIAGALEPSSCAVFCAVSVAIMASGSCVNAGLGWSAQVE